MIIMKELDCRKQSLDSLRTEGFCIEHNVLSPIRCDELNAKLLPTLEREAMSRSADFKEGIVPLPFLSAPEIFDYVINPSVLSLVDEVLSEWSLAYLLMSSFVPPNHDNYAAIAHRDVKFPTHKSPVIIGMLLLLTDFTADNGATVLYPKSHLLTKPDMDKTKPIQVCAPAGSAIFFDGRLLHNSMFNSSSTTRSCLAMAFCRPFVRPRFDYPRIIPKQMANGLNAYQRQKLGFGSIIPASFDEFNEIGKKRKFR